jgi:hypothetical protein
MAIQTFSQASFDDGNVTMQITFDDVSLVLQQLIYHNATTRGGALVLTGPKAGTRSCPANSDQTVDLTSLDIILVKRTGTGKYGPYVAYDLPGGEQISFQWPA